MGTLRTSRPTAGLLLLTLGLLLCAAPPRAQAQAPAECLGSNQSTPEDFGPTDISAVSGNQGLTAAFNPDATITVLKWPSPSYYDQIKYRTTDRTEPRFGALPNEGAFIGIAWDPDPTAEPAEGQDAARTFGFAWLRDWPSTQRFAGDNGDEVVTTFRKHSVGLKVTLHDVVAPYSDALIRWVKVRRTRSSPVRTVRVFAFANFNPVVSKIRRAPVADWCTEERNDDGGSYVEEGDAVLHTRAGVDESTGLPSSVALAMGFRSRSEGHQVGPDTYERTGPGMSAYDDARDGKLGNSDVAAGQADTALFDQLSLRRSRSATSTVLITAGESQEAAVGLLTDLRGSNFAQLALQKREWWRFWEQNVQLPQSAPASVERLAKRALISIRQATDRDSGLIVGSVATQSPQGLDWIRNGAFINRALDVAGHPEMVEKHNVRYAELQATQAARPPGGETTPAGNWSQNYYADGVVGGAIPYEIDETGLGIWTLWDHYALTQDRDYLSDEVVYEAIQRAAHYLTDDTPLGCRDPSTGLQCAANEEDNPNIRRTLVGAQAAWLGLRSAAQAARVRGGETALANAEKWENRAEELRAAIEANYFEKDGCFCYSQDYQVGGTLLFPVGLTSLDSKASESQADQNWHHIRRVLNGKADVGRLEVRAILGNAYGWSETGSNLRRLKEALIWIATQPTTDATGLLGEAWMKFPTDGKARLTTMVSQPHVWSQAMFYLAAIKVYGATDWARRR